MKGFIVDCNYVVRVKEIMWDVNLPYPRKKSNVLWNGDESLPIISINNGEDNFEI